MGIAERKEREKEQRKTEIIDAAERIFFSKGLQNATMDDVAEEAELSKGTLYLYFKNKEDLYLAIHLRGNHILKKMFEKAVKKHQKGIDKVRAIGAAYFDYYKKYPDYFNAMIYYESREINWEDEDTIASQCVLVGASTLEVLVQAIMIGINDGTIRPDVDPLKTAISLWGQSTGMIQIAVLKESMILAKHAIKVEEIVEYSFDLIFHALKV